MKKRNRKNRTLISSKVRKGLGPLLGNNDRKRKTWTFERLEDRLVFSTSPTVVSFSNDNPAGAAMTLLDEMNWAQAAAAASQGQSSDPLSSLKYVTQSLPNDPYFPDPHDPSKLFTQWYLLNFGQIVSQPDLQNLFATPGEDINLFPQSTNLTTGALSAPWDTLDANGNPITGQGVTVAVIDSGVQIFHPDLAANISPTLRFNSVTGTNNVSPDLLDPESFHGTAVAGIIGAVADNGIGGTGVAPGVTIVPIKADQNGGFSDQSLEDALLYALQNNIDITNNSLGPPGRTAIPEDPALLEILRDSVVFGRDGLGMINVYAAGNDAGPNYSPGFPTVLGDHFGSASYNPLVNSRYTIGVTGVSQSGGYLNPDGTFFDYPEAGASVLVAAPTGSSVLGVNNIADDQGFGSGITTTDLVGDVGANGVPLPGQLDLDQDALPNPDYTSRMNGTSASAPMVSGVIALMLQANPNLTYRDVEEILVRSARQNAAFDTPTTGGLGQALPARSTWQVNQAGPFRNPDPFDPLGNNNVISEQFDPIADPNIVGPIFNFTGSGGNGSFNEFAPPTNDDNRQFSSTYEPEPPVFTNGAGYTVSQGYGVYGEQIGYAHGVVDAAEAVYMAQHWDELKQNIAPNTELTYTTAVTEPGTAGFLLLAAEKEGTNPGAGLLVPGGIDGDPAGGFIAYWNQYFASPPFANYTGPPAEARGMSYIDFAVPPSQEMNVEWAEVKVDISGATTGLDGLRIMLVSPDGTQSELTNYYDSPSFIPFSAQPSSQNTNWAIDPGGTYGTTGGDFVWTFSTNRSWGENSSSEVIDNAATGEPVLQEVDSFDQQTQQLTTSMQPIFRNWELHIENWSATTLRLQSVEVVWHGKPIGGGTYDPNYAANGILSAQRVQGVVGIDTNGDNQFNFNRYVQTLQDGDNGPHADTSDIRTDDIQRTLDFTDNNNNGIYDEGDVINQEPFAENVIVDAYKVWNGVPEASPTARFLTGADGNYYFDLDPVGDLAQTKDPTSTHFGQTIEYEIKASDPMNRGLFLDDTVTPGLQTTNPAFTYLPHYASSWTINPNWFFAQDHDNTVPLSNNPGEVFFDPTGNANNIQGLVNPSDLPEPGLPSPVAFNDNATLDHIVPAPVKNLNFLLKDSAPAESFDVKGTVYSDVNGDGIFNGADAPAANIAVYWDQNRNGVQDPGEQTVLTDTNGHYTLHIDLSTLTPVPTTSASYQIGVVRPTNDWTFTDPGHDGVEDVYAGPGSPTQNINFFIQPPSGTNPNGNGPGTIQGVVFNDLNGDGIQELGENGVPNFRVFIDANQNGVWDSATEASVLTASNGAYFFSSVQPGIYRIDIVIPNEGTPAAAWQFTSPTIGYRDVQLTAGGSLTGVSFGLKNLAGSDWGDLPDSYQTTAAADGPSNKVQPGFQLGNTIDGEVNGQPSSLANADDSDDGVKIVSNGGILKEGDNTLEVTVFGVGGLLTGWMDFNNDGHFDSTEKLDWTLNGQDLGQQADINPGTYDLHITIPANAVDGRPIASRFRWGQAGLNFFGSGDIGETEDYFFGLNYIAGDYNRNGIVDQADYNLWRKTNGQNVTPFSGADGNGDGVVNQADFDIWRTHFGQMAPAPGAGAMVASASETAASSMLSAADTQTIIDYLTSLVNRASASSSVPAYSTLNDAASAATHNITAIRISNFAVPVPDVSSDTGDSLLINSVSSYPDNASPLLTLNSSPAFVSFSTEASASASTNSSSTTTASQSSSTSDASASDLLLLDQTWASLDDHAFTQSDDALLDGSSQETVSANDLALAAVLSDDDNQWNAI